MVENSIAKAKTSLIIATFAVSGASIFIRFCDSSALTIAFWRIFLAVVLLTPLLLYPDIRNQFLTAMNIKQIKFYIAAGFFLSLHFFSWIQSLQYTTVAASVIVVNSSPLWVTFLSFIFFRETINRFQVIGLILSFIGVILIAFLNSPLELIGEFQEGVILALFGGIMVALYFIIGKRMRSNFNISNIPYTYFVNIFCAFFLFIYSLVLSENVLNYSSNDFIWFLALAIGPSLLGHALYTYAMKRLSGQVVSITVLGEAVGASLLSFIFLSEVLSVPTIIGGIFIGVGIVMAVHSEQESTNE
ncbi:MAG: DMT family transporter [Candidatus Hodarchaeales archaeon]